MGTKATDPGELSKAIARIIDDALQERGVARARAAEIAGLSQPRANRILAGVRPMYVDELGALSEVLGRSAASIVREAEEAVRATTPDPAATYIAAAEAKLQAALQGDYAPAARRHEPDPLEGVGEENQDLEEN
ncbi:hypothetical protein R3J22_02520 [Trueperella bernardiae]|uniref:hypothetical protein n=1 Tax=Trueperella bernardiae TaxID=59561 RepID=UPI00294A860F|nr:hypothetical protein [Trueperella bernardiae]MDV6238402.1 hypothetical protein [Trueperella bernardiae]